MRIVSNVLLASSAILLANCASTNQQSPIYQQSTVYKGSTPQTSPVVQAGYQTQAPAQVTYAAQPVQQATYAQNSECLAKEGNRKLIGGVAGGAVGALAGRKIAGEKKTLGTVAGAGLGAVAGYAIADKTINCDPVQLAPAPQAPIPQAVTTPAYSTAYTQPYQRQVSYEAPAAVQRANGIQETTESLGADGTPGYYAVNGLTPPDTAQTAIVPAQPAPATQPAYVRTSPAALSQGSNIAYTIQPGDNVYRLAINNCSTVAELKQINGINDQFYIRAGDQILLPSGNCAK